MVTYLLFGSNDTEGGAHDFLGAYANRIAANEAALASYPVMSPGMSAWVHIAEFDGVRMKVTHRLNIPGTEWDEIGELVWVAFD